MDRRKATMSGFTLSLLTVLGLTSTIIMPYGYIVSLPLYAMIVHQLLLRLIFRGPSVRREPFEYDGWELLQTTNDGVDVFGHLHMQEEKADLVVFIHGWESTAERFLERMNLFKQRGLHTLAFNMRGHGLAPYTPEWTAGKVISDLKVMLNEIDLKSIDRIHFYGHSLGGFVSLGLFNHRNVGWWRERTGTLMLESPMVAYSPIMRTLLGKLAIFENVFATMAVNGFRKIHPEFHDLEWKDIDIPYWGVPDVPTLLLQSANDNRLGREHYDRFMELDVDVEAHLIESLSHSRNRVDKERDELIVQWIESRILN